MAARACQPMRARRRQENDRVLRFLRGPRHERTGYELYCAAVAAARAEGFYAGLGVPDTLDGRFDLVGLHVFLLIRRLRALPPPGADLAQAVFDAMFHDMDVNLREIGVGDMSVGKKVKQMWEALHGRAAAYQSALGSPDPAELEAALIRNVWRGAATPHAKTLARYVRRQDCFLSGQELSALAAGCVTFVAPAEALP
jgi:cytochrome b pre-mRNA-processing protein 3